MSLHLVSSSCCFSIRRMLPSTDLTSVSSSRSCNRFASRHDWILLYFSARSDSRVIIKWVLAVKLNLERDHPLLCPLEDSFQYALYKTKLKIARNNFKQNNFTNILISLIVVTAVMRISLSNEDAHNVTSKGCRSICYERSQQCE